MNSFIKYIASFLPLACLVLVANSTTAQNFQGEIVMTVSNPALQEETVVQWVTANGNHKLTMNGTAGGQSFSYVVLLLQGESNVRLLTDIGGQKAMFVTPISVAVPVNKPLGSAIVTVGDGSTSLAGYNCKKYTVESAEGAATVFVTDQVSLNVQDLPALLQKHSIFATLSANNISGMPLSIISRGADGKVTFSQTVTSIKPTTVSASEFSYEGYADGAAVMQNSVNIK